MAVTKTDEEVVQFVIENTGAANACVEKTVGEFLQVTVAYPDGDDCYWFKTCFVGQEDDELFGIGEGLHLSR